MPEFWLFVRKKIITHLTAITKFINIMLFSFKNSCDVFVSVSTEAFTRRILEMLNFNSAFEHYQCNVSFNFLKKVMESTHFGAEPN